MGSAVSFLDRECDYRGEATFQITVLCCILSSCPRTNTGLEKPDYLLIIACLGRREKPN